MTGSRAITLPWIELVPSSHFQAAIPPRRSLPKTLVVQSDSSGFPIADDSAGPRDERDFPVKPRAIHSPHALRLEADADASQVATAKLFAPRRLDDEELAGLDRGALTLGSLASQSVSRGIIRSDSETLSSSAANAYSADDQPNVSPNNDSMLRREHGLGGGWPETPKLINDLEFASRVANAKGLTFFASAGPTTFNLPLWHESVAKGIQQLTTLPTVNSAGAGQMLDDLSRLAQEGLAAGDSIGDRETQIRVLRVAQGLQRRLAVWNAVWRTTQGTVTRISDMPATSEGGMISRKEIGELLVHLGEETLSSDDAEGWQKFLMLRELEDANASEDPGLRKLVAQRFLSRLTWYRLSEEHRDWLDRQSIRSLSIAVRRWAATPLDYAALLAQLERQETDAIDLGGIDVASAVQSLRFAESREANRIADALNTYYRNANVRFAVTDELVQRLIPDVDAQIKPVRDRILGADVRGTSVVNSDLSLRLIPSDHSWKMSLENLGHVSTGASSRQWPVSIRSRSQATFLASTPLEITRDGATAGATNVAVNTRTKVGGVSTDFDAIPIVNTLIREIAMNRYDSMAPLAQQIQKTKIRGGVGQEVDTRIAEQLDQASTTLARRLTGPLSTLSLSPMVVDMQTTENRLSARYRVAGDWQLAAFTPRPRAPQKSLLSFQLHQSAINNTLETILPAGEPKLIGDLITQVRELFTVEAPIALSDDEEIAADTSIQFASTRPITVEVHENIVWVTMRVMRLKQKGGIDLRRFIVRAGYRPEISGLSAHLVREGHLRISGPDMSMRDRLPVRAIFNKVFSTRRQLPLLPEKWLDHPAMQGLAITQAELRDGWIAIAIGHAADVTDAPHIASAEEGGKSEGLAY